MYSTKAHATTVDALPQGALSYRDAAWLIDEMHLRMRDWREATADARGATSGPAFERAFDAENRLLEVEHVVLMKLRGVR